MKVGDLIELSMKGKNLKICKEFIGMIGLIREVDSTNKLGTKKEWYYVDWCGGRKNQPHMRTDLKFVGKR